MTEQNKENKMSLKERIVNNAIAMGVWTFGCLLANTVLGFDTHYKLHSEERNHGKLAAIELAKDISKKVDKNFTYYFELGSKLVADNYIKNK